MKLSVLLGYRLGGGLIGTEVTISDYIVFY